MELGGKIKQMRNQKGLTQEELADRCELTKGYISQLENDLNSPSIATLTDILSALGSNLSEFFREEAKEKVVFGKEEYFEKLKIGKTPFQFIVCRKLPNGKPLFNTNIKVTMEDYRITESAGNGFDVTVKIRMKQYRNYGTKSIAVQGTVTTGGSTATYTANVEPTRSRESAPNTKKNRNYTVRKNESLFNIAKEQYGDGGKFAMLYNANKDKITDPTNIKPGTVLVLPAI